MKYIFYIRTETNGGLMWHGNEPSGLLNMAASYGDKEDLQNVLQPSSRSRSYVRTFAFQNRWGISWL